MGTGFTSPYLFYKGVDITEKTVRKRTPAKKQVKLAKKHIAVVLKHRTLYPNDGVVTVSNEELEQLKELNLV